MYFANRLKYICIMQYEIFVEKNIRVDKKEIDKIIKKFIRFFKLDKKKYLSVAVVSSAVMKKMNYKYRRKNKATDVLSFSEQDSKDGFVDPDFLGEIIICYPIARKQAKEFKYRIKDEIHRLLIHGLVHLMGYDHQTVKEREEMEEKELKILGSKFKNLYQ